MDWFEHLTGFREKRYEETRRHLEVDGRQLRSRVNGRSYGIGELELVSLQTLRERVQSSGGLPGRLKACIVTGDVGRLHKSQEYSGALFQVASQFNLLEMTGPEVTPEDGVTRYIGDPTQGPACAIAAGAATIYRNYFVPVGGAIGQTAQRQLDGIADLGAALSEVLNRPVASLWTMRNGYAQCTRAGLDAITEHLGTLDPMQTDELRGKLRIGVHSDVEVTDPSLASPPVVSQAFCSALPMGTYTSVPREHWRSFASLVLEAAYEATLWAGVLNTQRGASNLVLLTRLGGGAFGNEEDWIHAAMRRAMQKALDFGLDVRLVTYRTPPKGLLALAAEFA
jgi:hypothetical protein